MTPADLNERAIYFGSNYREPTKRNPFCKLFLGALDDFMLKILLVCACVSMTIDMSFAEPHERSHGNIHFSYFIFKLIAWIEGAAIFIAVFVVASVGSWNDYKKEEQFLKL